MRGMWTMAVVAVGLGSLGCSGLMDMAMDAAENNPDFQKSFKESFKKEFVAKCASGSTSKGVPEGAAEKVCTCAATELLDKHSPKELMKLVGDLDSPKNAKELEQIVKDCAK